MVMAPQKDAHTMVLPCFKLNSPDANGKYGLLILSSSMSSNWLIPTMKMLQNKPVIIALVKSNKCSEALPMATIKYNVPILIMVPMMVCGLLNLISVLMRMIDMDDNAWARQ